MKKEPEEINHLVRVHKAAGAKVSEDGNSYTTEDGLLPITILVKVVPTQVTTRKGQEPLIQFDVMLGDEEWDLITLPADQVIILCRRPEWHDGPCGDPTEEELAEMRR